MSTDLAGRLRSVIEAAVGRMGTGAPISVALEVPPRPELGDLACPVAFELARKLKRSPREIASELKGQIEGVSGVERVEVAGGGYVNIYFDRDLFLRSVAREIGKPRPAAGAGKRIVEHTNINPNKAAHIGHLRNAVLGDTLVRCLRFLGHQVEVQNYIDDTGVQVADVAVGFVDVRGLMPDGVQSIADRCSRVEEWSEDTQYFLPGQGLTSRREEFPADYAFDHYCWDLYAEVASFYAASEENAAKRAVALAQMEKREGPYASVAQFVSRLMVLHHLRTMRWIDVRYDLLPHESDILALGFWHSAFELLKVAGAIRLASEGKAKGCWVMDLPDADEGEDEGAKIIVRSNGTVTYVGKDIAYQMWKFGLLGRDFSYRRIDPGELRPNRTDELFTADVGPGEPVWSTCSNGGEKEHPRFGGAERVYNVIDVRQSYLQKVVAQGLRALGHEREAQESIHFYYEMVALTPRSVSRLADLGLLPNISVTEEDLSRTHIEMSGRRGIGVKAEELLTALANSAHVIVDQRSDIPAETRARVPLQIAVGALRYYMLRFTRNRVVAFDVEDSLAFEGETGPYLQYAAVRSRNIFNKMGQREEFDEARVEEAIVQSRFSSLDPADAIEHWQIVREIARLPEFVEQAVSSLELAILARYVFSVAQRFSSFYHRHPVLHEPDPARRDLRIALNEIYLRFMKTSLSLMGIPVPERM